MDDDRDRFSTWFPLDAPAPPGPGVVQCKVVDELIRYPSGASAMLRYESAASIAELVRRAAEATAGHFAAERVRWRYQAAEPAVARALLDRLRARFIVRFGAPPLLDPLILDGS
jgi:hypothetical protein